MNKKLTMLFIIVIIPHFLNGFYNPIIVSTPYLYWLVEIITWVIAPLIILSYCIKTKLISLNEIGFHTLVNSKNNRLLFIISLIYTPVILYFSYKFTYSLSESIFPINYLVVNFNYYLLLPEPGIKRNIIALYFAISAGFFEEISYRAILFKIFNKINGGYIIFILISSLIFSSVHWEGGIRNIFSSFIYGLICATLYYKLKNIWPLVIGHIITDLILFLSW